MGCTAWGSSLTPSNSEGHGFESHAVQSVQPVTVEYTHAVGIEGKGRARRGGATSARLLPVSHRGPYALHLIFSLFAVGFVSLKPTLVFLAIWRRPGLSIAGPRDLPEDIKYPWCAGCGGVFGGLWKYETHGQKICMPGFSSMFLRSDQFWGK